MVYRIPPRQGEFIYSGDVYQALIPKNHFLRKVDAAIDFSFANEECRSLYCPDNGRPTTNYPEKMLRAEFLQYHYELSDREMEERARYDLAFRWFLGLGAMDEAFEFSAMSEFRTRLGPEMHKTLFDRVLDRLKEEGLVTEKEPQNTDSTDVAANVARLGTSGLIHRAAAGLVRTVEKASPAGGEAVRKEVFRTKEDDGEPREQSRNEVEARRSDLQRAVDIAQRSVAAAHAWVEGKEGLAISPEGRGRITGAVELVERILAENVEVKRNEKGEDEAHELDEKAGDKLVSVVDKDARHGAKSKTKKFIGYKAHVAVTDQDVITRVEVTPGNSADGRQLTPIRDGMERDHGLRPEKMRADSAYGTGENIRDMERRGTMLVAPLANGGRPSGGFPKEQFIFDAERGVIVCPAGKESIWSRHREQLHGTIHEFSLRDCGPCPLKAQCTKARVRAIFISDYEPAFERMRTYLKTDDGKRDRKLRSERERVFEEMKDRHGMRKARYWGLAKMRIQAYMTAIVVDIKRLVGWLDRRSGVVARAM